MKNFANPEKDIVMLHILLCIQAVAVKLFALLLSERIMQLNIAHVNRVIEWIVSKHHSHTLILGPQYYAQM